MLLLRRYSFYKSIKSKKKINFYNYIVSDFKILNKILIFETKLTKLNMNKIIKSFIYLYKDSIFINYYYFNYLEILVIFGL